MRSKEGRRSHVLLGLTLLFENVPYGRYTSRKYGFPVNVKVAWFVQELPALLVPVGLIFWASALKISHLPNQLLLCMYFCHYVQRSLVYPFLIRGGKPTPFASFALAFVFCIYNGYLQVRYLSQYADFPQGWVSHPCFITGGSLVYPFLIRGGKPTPFASFALAFVFCIYNGYLQVRYLSQYADFPQGWVSHPCFITGSCLWLLGWIINLHSDHILRNLRSPGETDYKIPRGGVFEYVSGANFLGEIVEWAGFALAAHSVHSFAFAFFTAIVLSSRAISHHRWYLKKFEDYPKSRKALIPFVL
ncbi:3-oxo-5-alpha-steroid 4-dehydrogenase 1 isoform X1 [Silurus asotus]|uniref:3-oxo-5-alpha-steroid 4-dehydrogenase 1 n=1 Tax=Silurus asotus TaxID=30991 RepID=A0AAD5AT35_SILAS|nr:3-oxo-5-alpha-steroid 4-dehydrogenase 1 isoform X1 [Silurus asotus]